MFSLPSFSDQTQKLISAVTSSVCINTQKVIQCHSAIDNLLGSKKCIG
jgi:hypothetical protein